MKAINIIKYYAIVIRINNTDKPERKEVARIYEGSILVG